MNRKIKYKDFESDKAKSASIDELAQNAMMLEKSFKNREGLLPIGTRVRPSYDRLSGRVGTVIEHSEDGNKMVVKWDDDKTIGPSGYFMIPEVRRAN